MTTTDEPTIAPALAQVPPREPWSVRAEVRDRIRRAIALQQLPAGTRLNQEQLARQLGVSRMPVRDAINDLIAEDLVETVASGGAVVRALTANDLRGVYEVRLALELPAVRQVALHGSGPWRAELGAIMDSHQSLLQESRLEELHRLDRDFHWAIYRATGNRFIGRALTPVWSHISRAMFGLLAVESYAAIAWAEHHSITDALLAGDADRAAAVMEVHVRNGADRLLQVMDAAPAGGPQEPGDDQVDVLL